LAVFFVGLAVAKMQTKNRSKKEQPMNRKLILALTILTTLALGLAFWPSLANGLAAINNPQVIILALRQSGWGPLALIALLILQVFLAFIPGQALMIASAYVYGFWGGTLLTWASLTLGGQLAFWLARTYGRPFASRFISPDVTARWDRIAARQGVGFYAMSLVLPVFPNDAMCYVAGLGEISPRRFLLANMLGRLLATLIASFVGAYGTQIPMTVWAGLAFAVGVGLLIWKIVPSLRNKKGCAPCLPVMKA
jgi:uncharacterized membrane protein YdjX (TVP38/TMEM64 family)